jgi:hypothetical protein
MSLTSFFEAMSSLRTISDDGVSIPYLAMEDLRARLAGWMRVNTVFMVLMRQIGNQSHENLNAPHLNTVTIGGYGDHCRRFHHFL